MKPSPQIPRNASTATPTVALWILGVIFLAQFVAVGWAVFGPEKLTRFSHLGNSGTRESNHITEIGEIGQPGSESPGIPESDLRPGALPLPPGSVLPPGSTENPGASAIPPLEYAGSPDSIPRELGGTRITEPDRTTTNFTSKDPDEPFYIVPASARIRNPEVLGTIQAAVKMREEGDTQGSLESLRRADFLRPENPRILHEFATTYFLMGLRDKAYAYWERVRTMGESGAGDYFALAEIQLGETENEVSGDPIPDSLGTIHIGDVVATRDPNARDGERISLRIPIHSRPGSAIRPDQVAAYIYFFDLVGGDQVMQTTPGTEISQTWSSAPIDWGLPDPEILDVTYFQRPALPTATNPTPPTRRYYGYIIRLFYENTLQDVIANPRTLIDFNAGDDSDSNPMLDNSLFGGG